MNKLIASFHRLIGTILALFFLMWFVSGFVLMFHKYPRLSSDKAFSHFNSIQSPVQEIDVIDSLINSQSLESASLKIFNNKASWFLKEKKQNVIIDAVNLNEINQRTIPYSSLSSFISSWNPAPINRIKEMKQLDIWLPYSRYKKHLPIYKIYFDDKDKSQLYLSSFDGSALQYTTSKQRFWAYLGGIPHWLYIGKLRENKASWSKVVAWISGIGALMCLSGIILGVQTYTKVYKKRKRWKTPYRKWSYKWHHILGFVFGFFVFAYVLSGFFTVVNMPEWIVPVKEDNVLKKIRKQKPIQLEDFKIDINKVIAKYQDEHINSIDLEYFGDIPIYRLNSLSGDKYFRACSDDVVELTLNESDIQNLVEKRLNIKNPDITFMDEFDSYYVGLTQRMALPVYKVNLNNADKGTLYIQPGTGYIRYFDNNRRVKKWIYPAFHSYRTKFMVEHPTIRRWVLYITLLGGTIVSLTGVILGFKYLRRGYKKLKRRRI